MRMTERHVAAVTRQLPDPGFQVFPGMRPATDEDYDAAVAAIMAGAPEGGFWVFAYGSLIWNPAFDFVERAAGRWRAAGAASSASAGTTASAATASSRG